MDNIVNEIIWLQKTYDFKELEIVDDIFNFDIRHAKIVFKKLSRQSSFKIKSNEENNTQKIDHDKTEWELKLEEIESTAK